MPRLFGALNIACEQDDARWLQPLQQGSERRRHLRAPEANDQKLACDSVTVSYVYAHLEYLLQFFAVSCESYRFADFPPETLPGSQ
jgi:hypothetical protein